MSARRLDFPRTMSQAVEERLDNQGLQALLEGRARPLKGGKLKGLDYGGAIARFCDQSAVGRQQRGMA